MSAYWIMINPNNDGCSHTFECSQCGQEVHVWAIIPKLDYDFCPHCGELMDREKLETRTDKKPQGELVKEGGVFKYRFFTEGVMHNALGPPALAPYEITWTEPTWRTWEEEP